MTPFTASVVPTDRNALTQRRPALRCRVPAFLG